MAEEFSKVQWFPGHMAKARRKIEESISKVDLVLELCDARIPKSSRNPLLSRMLRSKPRLLLLNKSDLADPAQTAKWLGYYEKKKIPALAIDAKSGKNLKKLLPKAREILSEKIAAWEKRGMVGRSIRIMVVGIPNVGKSALINALCRGSGVGKAEVRDQPGVTRENRWFTIGKGFDLLDTPGVLWHKFEDPRQGEALAFTGAVNDEILDTYELALHLLKKLCILAPKQLAERYKLSDEALSLPEEELLSTIALRRGMLISGGEVDTERCALMLLDEFRGGKIGAITLEQVE